MRSSPVVKKTRLLSPWVLLLIAILVGTLLVVSFSGKDAFLPDDNKPDAVSVNYAELLLKADPENQELREKLIGQLIELGSYDAARRHINELPVTAPDLKGFFELELDTLEALAKTEGVDASAKAALVARIEALPRIKLSDEQLKREASYALALGAPAVAASIYDELAVRQPEKKALWLDQAAKWFMAGSEPGRAAEVYKLLLDDEKDPQKRLDLIYQTVLALRGANQDDAAAIFLSEHMDALSGHDSELLDEGFHAALGSNRYDLAEQFVALWREQEPNDKRAIKAEFDLHMASGNIAAAWPLGQLLVAEDPDNPELLSTMGKLGEWVGQSIGALDYWERLLALKEDPQVREHAWRLAAQLFEFDRAIPLLVELGDMRELTPEEIDSLVYSYESLGEPEEEEQWLRRYTKAHPGQELGWLRLQQLLERTQQFKAETQIWAQLDKRFGISTSERVSWAHAHWKLFDEQAAWQVLTAKNAHAEKITDPEYWRLRAELAWATANDQDTQYSFEQLLALNEPLYSSEREQLLNIYQKVDPVKALALAVSFWNARHRPERLASALDLAEKLGDWEQYAALVASAEKVPGTENLQVLWNARAQLAIRAGDLAKAERIYAQALKRFPTENIYRQQLLWLYIDQGRHEDIERALNKWQSIARADGIMWLPFASANLMLNRTERALAWLKLYLQANPDDLLANASYADALDSAGYQEAALRLRSKLLKQMQTQTLPADPDTLRIYLRLLASAQSQHAASAQAARMAGDSKAMLQLWFEQYTAQLSTNGQADINGQWLAWAEAQGLKLERYEQLSEAVRTLNRTRLQAELDKGGLDPLQETEVLAALGKDGQAHAYALSHLSDQYPSAVSNQLRGMLAGVIESTPQGAQLGWRSEDFGGLKLQGARGAIARNITDDWYARLDLFDGRYDSDSLDESVIGNERNAELQLQRTMDNGVLGFELDGSWRDDEDRYGFGLFRTLRLTSRDLLRVDLDVHREADESGLLRALGMRDGLTLGGQHNLTARDQIAWSIGQQYYQTRQGDDIGSGQKYSLEYNHTLFFAGPAWVLRTGVDYQSNSLENTLPNDLLTSTARGNAPGLPGGALDVEGATPETLLEERYGQLYFGTSWQRGLPGSLNRSHPQYTWFVDMQAGWQWVDQEVNYGISTGLGMEVVGDDELAFSMGYQSAPQNGDGESGGTAAITYSTRFGR
ncbi:tetratricopeptide repeat protein [Pseudomonas segetis]|uniref:Tetratricopeptide repeat-containing protein n=2 Tax=Pseudomonas TaxID=286 RepID=A0A239F713_9PSED|nr:tetratricopeptide repeat protein [Pseudomonas segetis]SNS52605.1 Tetratricopeptide repeat-containing protein [Pseudomonas segetis]